MNTKKLAAFFNQHKTAVLGVAGAGVVGLALLQRNKTGSGADAPPAGGASPVPVTWSSPQPAAPYSSTGSDIYNAIQPQLERLQQIAQQQNTPPTPVPAAPIASTLFAPTNSGDYVGFSKGGIFEVQSDGSLYHLSGPEWQQIIQSRGGDASYTGITGSAPGTDYSHVGNISNKIKSAAAKFTGASS